MAVKVKKRVKKKGAEPMGATTPEVPVVPNKFKGWLSSRRGKCIRVSHTQAVIVTPSVAADILANHNPDNRKIKKHRVVLLARSIERDRWVLTHQGIVFDSSWNLIDGQHRLAACVHAKKSIKTIIMVVDQQKRDEVLPCIDVVAARKGADFFALKGEKYGSHLSVALGWLEALRTQHKKPQTMLPEELEERLDGDPELRESVAIAMRLYGQNKTFTGPKGMWGAIHYLASLKASPAEADAFLTKLATGIGLVVGDPVHALRKKLDHNLVCLPNKRYPAYMLCAYAVKAWNAVRAGLKFKTAGQLVFNETKEKFPEILS